MARILRCTEKYELSLKINIENLCFIKIRILTVITSEKHLSQLTSQPHKTVGELQIYVYILAAIKIDNRCNDFFTYYCVFCQIVKSPTSFYVHYGRTAAISTKSVTLYLMQLLCSKRLNALALGVGNSN